MHKDDISRLCKQLGMPINGYLDFQMQRDFRARIDSLLAGRALVAGDESVNALPEPRKNKVVAIVSTGHLPGRKLVASLARMASHRSKGKLPVHIVDLIAFDGMQEEKAFLLNDGIKHVLLDTSVSNTNSAIGKDAAWVKQEIAGEGENGFVVVDVPERVLHARHDVLINVDTLLVLIPATLDAIVAIEKAEREIADLLSSGVKCSVSYLLVAAEDSETLSALLVNELLSFDKLFVPFLIDQAVIPSADGLLTVVNKGSQGYEVVNKVLSFILEGASREDR